MCGGLGVLLGCVLRRVLRVLHRLRVVVRLVRLVRLR